MRVDGPSLTARGVASARLGLVRPAAPTGDPAADDRLAQGLAEGIAEALGERDAEVRRRRRAGGDFLGFLAARTRFFDDAVLGAIAAGVDQIVILGAGYDGRALRFRTPGVQFFEVDHPATQADKRERLAAIAAGTEGITFVAADFTEPGLDDALTAGGYDRGRRALFTCEGVLRYLPEPWFRELLRVTCDVAAPTSELAVSISTRPPAADSGAATEGDDDGEPSGRRRWLASIGEPVLTVPPTDVALAWLADSGWHADQVTDVADPGPDSAGRRGRLLVHAHR
jgi:methyltransferase (TIGR00027 family)